MGQVTVTVNGRAYQIACEDGKERHVEQLAAYVEAHVSELAKDVGQVGEARLLMMASLLIADDLKAAHNGAGRHAGDEEAAAALVLERCAERLQAIAAHLEGH